MNVLMPQLGETVAEGTIAVWHKKVGDTVGPDDILFDVETDKASMEVPAQAAGVIKEIRFEVGQTVDVGTVVAVIDDGRGASLDHGGDRAAETGPPPATATPPGAATETDDTATVGTGPEPSGGGGGANAGGVNAGNPPRASATVTAIGAVERSGNMRLSPAVRRLAAEHQIDLAAVSGSGRNDRITRRNVIEFISDRQSEPQTASSGAASAPSGQSHTPGAPQAPAPAPAPAAAQAAPATARPQAPAGGNVQPFTRIRRLTAEHMVRSKTTSPHVLQAVEVDFQRVEQVRRIVRDAWKSKHGSSLTFLPFVAHAVCEALREFASLNASVQGDGLVLHDSVNLAIAVDLGAEGLVAPVIRGAQELSVAEMARAISDVAQRARSNRLKPDDFSGGTYTLSNSGTFGTLITAPIINQPQVAILSIDGVRKKPVVVESSEGDSIAIRPVGILAQSFDHRAVDGAYSAAFLDRVRKLLETSRWVVDV
jgi:2-oxoglutarate dehydrogenase E2 component (dihydrolipoamide succinyltransferase)